MVNIFYSTDNFESRTAIAENIVLPLDELKDIHIDLSDKNIEVEEQKPVSLRVYPWLFGGIDGDAYFNIRDVELVGLIEGVVIPDLPQVQTLGVDEISTQSVLFKGNAIDDGGVAIDSLGVVYSTIANPDISSSVALGNAQKGFFQTKIEGLTVSTRYFAKAFIANGAGITYGNEIEFTTLDKLSVPGVSTTNVSHISNKGAVAYGQVYFDGGLEVTLTGFCYSKQVSPTLSNLVASEGVGLGEYNAYLNEVEAGQTYYVRAFAENSEGVGYGNQLEFTTPATLPDINIVVDKNGNGDYTSLQEAFNAVPYNYMGNIYVNVKKGIYDEKVILKNGQINVHLIGESRDSTIIRWDDYSGKVVDGVTLGTSTSQTIAIDADDFIAQNISFQNTSQVAQAVALRVKGDRMIFQYCKLLGFQDTYYTWGVGRVYNEDCYIEGTVDFIFGSSIAIFEKCEIRSLRNSPITAAATPENYKFGYVLMNSKLVADETIKGTTLGRPWKPYAQTVYIETKQGKHIRPEGWLEWNGNNNHLTAYYAEYNCSGEGYVPDMRVEWSHQLTEEQAKEYTIENIFNKKSASPAYYYNWVPDFERVDVPLDTMPIDTTVVSNLQVQSCKVTIYPNPSRSETNFSYELRDNSYVDMAIYTLDGRLVEQLIKDNQLSGKHKITWSPANTKSGIYLCKVLINNQNISQLLLIE
jgi:pectin methylesterase-like acyl-CoA thioesterase